MLLVDRVFSTSPSRHAAARRVCMVTHSFYESDNRVILYAECLAGAGDHVEVLALRRTPDLPKKAIINGVMVHRIQDRFAKNDG